MTKGQEREPLADDTPADNLNPVSPIYYWFSTFLCVARMVTSRSGNEQAARMGWEPERSLVIGGESRR